MIEQLHAKGLTEQITADVFDIASRVVCHSYVGSLMVSTVRIPLLFADETVYETMILGYGYDDEYQEQWATVDDAQAGHTLAVNRAVEWCRERGHDTDVSSFGGEAAASELQRRTENESNYCGALTYEI